MMYEFLVILHVIGTVLGVGSATFAEIHYTRFNSDNIITDDEKKTLATTYTVMRLGLFLLTISGFGFLLYFRLTENVAALTDPTFWAKMTIVASLIGNALLLQARVMPFKVGTAVSLASWYMALILGVIGSSPASYLELIFLWGLAVIGVAIALDIIRSKVHPAKI